MWKGVIIEESLDNRKLLNYVNVLLRKPGFLGGDADKGKMFFDKVEVKDEDIFEAVSLAKSSIKKGWYMHFCKDHEMIVIYRGISFEHKKGNKTSLDAIRRYGKSLGILEEQLPDDSLIDDPWG